MATSHLMMMDKSTVVQRAIREVTRDISFTNRWTSVISIEKGINSRYQFDNTTKITKMSISRSLSKIEPCLDSLTIQNSSGIYRGKYKGELFYFFQKGTSEPPYFPPPIKINIEEWTKITEVDQLKLEEYISRNERSRSMQRSGKKAKLDDVDIFVKNKRLSLEAESMSSMNTNTNTSTISEFSYWKSPEAMKLFNPQKNEEVLDCLSNE